MSTATLTNQTFIAFRGQANPNVYTCFLNGGSAVNPGWSTSNGWTDSTCNDSNSTYVQPAAVVFSSRYFVAFVPGSSNKICITTSTDGVTWPGSIPIGESSALLTGVCAVVFKERLYVAFVASDSTNRVLVTSSEDGFRWTPGSAKWVQNATTTSTPAMAVYKDKLWVAWQGLDGQIYLNSSSDGVSWGAQATLAIAQGTLACAAPPNLTAYNGALYMALVESDQDLYVSSTTAADGTGWSAPVPLNRKVLGGQGAAIGAVDGALMLLWPAPTTNALCHATSTDGKKWIQKEDFQQWSPRTPSIATGAAPHPISLRAPAATQMFTAFVASDSSRNLFACFYDSARSPWTQSGWTNCVYANNQTPSQPAAAVFNSRYFIAFVSNNASRKLLITHSEDCLTWPAGINTPHSIAAGTGPSVAVFQSQLFVAFIAKGSNNSLYVVGSRDGITWPATGIKVPNAISTQTPSLVVHKGQLWVAWVDSAKTLRIASSSDGVSWTAPASGGTFTVSGGASCPVLGVFKGTLRVTFLDSNQAAHIVDITDSGSGTLFGSPAAVGATVLLGQPPALTALDDTLHLVYTAADKSVQYSTSTDGTHWTARGSFSQASLFAPSLASGPAGPLPLSILGKGQLFAAFTANDPSHQLWATFYDENRAPWMKSGWTGGIATNSTNRTELAPAAAVFKAQYFIAFVLNNTAKQLQITSSKDGVTWTNARPVIGSSSQGPSLAVFGPKLYMGLVAADSTQRVLVGSSADGSEWTASSACTQISGSTGSTKSPALSVLRSTLFAAYLGTDQKIYISVTNDGVTWTSATAPTSLLRTTGQSAWSSAPALYAHNNRLYLAIADASGNLYASSTSTVDGQGFTAPVLLGQTVQSGQAPSLCAYNGQLVLMWPAADASKDLLYSTSTDGSSWVFQGRLAEQSPAAASLAAGTMAQLARPLAAPPSQVLSVTSPQPVSALPGWSSRSFTLEAWICQWNPSQQQTVLLLSTTEGVAQIILTAGGGSGDLTLSATSRTLFPPFPIKTFVACTAPGRISSGVWTHVAATLGIDGNGVVSCTLYVNGALAATQSHDPRSGLDAMLLCTGIESGVRHALNAPIIPVVSLGMTATPSGRTLSTFQGQLSEVRIWNTVRSSAEIAAGSMSRMRGDEPGLMCCYRLEEAPKEYVRNLTARRGFGKLASGNSIVTANRLPLHPTTGSANISLRAMGKRMIEKILYPEWLSGPTDLFDALLQPRALDGGSLAGRNILIRPDEGVTAVLELGGFAAKVQWHAGRTYSVAVPADGKIRVRFVVSQSTAMFPALRLRVDGMQPGVWNTLFLDEGLVHSLVNLNADDLAQPASGGSSPLPSTLTAAERTTLADAFNKLGAAVPPASSSYSVPGLSAAATAGAPSGAVDEGRRRGLFNINQALDSIESAGEYVVDAAGDISNDVGDYLQQAGAECGTLMAAYIDDGRVALSGITSGTRTVSTLFSNTTDLIKAGTKATARYGSQAISDCINSAQTIAVATDKGIAGCVTIVGTTIVDGSTVVWRTVCAGVHEVATTASAIAKKIGAEISKILSYLSFLFKWDDFTETANSVYNYLATFFGTTLPSSLDALAQSDLVTRLQEILTIPPEIGGKSLAQICQINLDPENPAFQQMDHVLELVQKLLSSDAISVSAMEASMGSLSSLTGIDLSSISNLGDTVASSTPTDPLSSPLKLFTTPISGLLNSLVASVMPGDGSAQTGSASPFISFFLQSISGIKTALAAGYTLLTARMSVPGYTSLIEQTLLDGSSLSLLRLGALAAAIPAVITWKLMSAADRAAAQSQSGSGPTSFAEPSSSSIPFVVWAPWVNVALSAIFSALITAQTVAAARKSSTQAVTVALLDLGMASISVAQCGLNFRLNENMSGARKRIMDASASLSLIAAALQGLTAVVQLYQAWFGGMSSTLARTITGFGAAINGLCTVGQMITSVLMATSGILQTAADWTQFAFTMASVISSSAAWLVEKINEMTASLGQVVLAMAALSCTMQVGAAVSGAVAFN